jgi:enterochelin esterase-like enzyme
VRLAGRSALCVVLLGINVAAQTVQVVSPEVGPDRRVTFRVHAPAAMKVEVVQLAVSPSQGFSANSQTLPMTRQGNVWSATSGPLAPDIYTYRFRLDGKEQNDPANPAFVEEFSGDRTSKISIPGALWTDATSPAGRFTRHTYKSALIGGDEEYAVYTPPAYDRARADPYPVLYLLHGAGDNAATWVTNGGVDLTLNNLIARGRAKPMVIVMPLGYGTTSAVLDATKFEQALFREIVPRIDQTYHVSRNAVDRAIAGVSMGGTQAYSIGVRHLTSFAWIGIFSGAYGVAATQTVPDVDPKNALLDLTPLRLLFIGYGASESPFQVANSRSLGQGLAARSVRVATVEVAGLGHVWPVWRRVVGDFLQLVFQEPPRPPSR